ncbi:MAG: hypothetical protein H7833_06215 [Magnetococcus sp. DMHC-1]
MIQRALTNPEQTYAALFMDGTHSMVIVAHAALSAAVVRSIPIGALTLARALAQANNISLAEALTSLRQEDLISAVPFLLPSSNSEAGSEESFLSINSQALQVSLSTLLKELIETLAYFSFQRASGKPESLELLENGAPLVGLRQWLGQHVRIPVQSVRESLLEQYGLCQLPAASNLLRGATSSLLTVGRTNFYYDEKQGFVRSEELKTPPPGQASLSAAAGRTPGQSAKQRRASARKKRAENQPSLFSRLLQRKTTESAPLSASMEAKQNETRDERALFALAGLFVFIVCYWGFSQYKNINKEFSQNSSAFLETRDSYDRLLSGESAHKAQPVTGEIDKVLWAEKFLILSQHMDAHIWITDIYLSGSTKNDAKGPTLEKQDKSAKAEKKLVIEGRVLPSTDGHIDIIAKYIDRLLKDPQFMSDFQSINFAGAQLQSGNDQVVTFTLEANYDRNKRKTTTNASKSVPLVEKMKESVAQRERSINSAIPRGQ